MSASNVSGESFGEEFEILCDRFEAEWRSGAQPRIELYVAQAPERARYDILRELLKLDIYYRRDRGSPLAHHSFREPHVGRIEPLARREQHLAPPHQRFPLGKASKYQQKRSHSPRRLDLHVAEVQRFARTGCRHMIRGART
jgi:hypothetical protein